MIISQIFPQHPSITNSATSYRQFICPTPYCFSTAGVALSALGAFTFFGAAAFLAFGTFGAAATLSFLTFGAAVFAFFGAAGFFSVAVLAFLVAAGFVVFATVAFFTLVAAPAVTAFLTGA